MKNANKPQHKLAPTSPGKSSHPNPVLPIPIARVILNTPSLRSLVLFPTLHAPLSEAHTPTLSHTPNPLAPLLPEPLPRLCLCYAKFA